MNRGMNEIAVAAQERRLETDGRINVAFDAEF
jgi:hypothetical protein